jgi:hypothetical protein
MGLKLPAILKGKRLPEPKSRYDIEIELIPDLLRVRRSICFSDEWRLLVKFTKGWHPTVGFNTMWYDQVITAVEAVLPTKDPVKIFEAASQEVYGHKGILPKWLL